MIKKNLFSIFTWLIVPCLFIALFLYSIGVERVEFDDKYYRFFSSVLQVQEQWKLNIPNIPLIPSMGNDFIDFLFGFINGLTNVINILINLTNVVINMLQFIISIFVAIVDNLKGIFNSNIVINSSQLCHI